MSPWRCHCKCRPTAHEAQHANIQDASLFAHSVPGVAAGSRLECANKFAPTGVTNPITAVGGVAPREVALDHSTSRLTALCIADFRDSDPVLPSFCVAVLTHNGFGPHATIQFHRLFWHRAISVRQFVLATLLRIAPEKRKVHAPPIGPLPTHRLPRPAAPGRSGGLAGCFA